MKGPTLKQTRLVEEYLIDLNATQAAIRAGYREKTANEQGLRLLENLSIAAAVENAMAERSERTKVTQDYVLATIVETVERCKQGSPILDCKGEQALVETLGGDLAPAYTFNARAALKGAIFVPTELRVTNARGKQRTTMPATQSTMSPYSTRRICPESLGALGVATPKLLGDCYLVTPPLRNSSVSTEITRPSEFNPEHTPQSHFLAHTGPFSDRPATTSPGEA